MQRIVKHRSKKYVLISQLQKSESGNRVLISRKYRRRKKKIDFWRSEVEFPGESRAGRTYRAMQISTRDLRAWRALISILLAVW